jgi:hypothetical protein
MILIGAIVVVLIAAGAVVFVFKTSHKNANSAATTSSQSTSAGHNTSASHGAGSPGHRAKKGRGGADAQTTTTSTSLSPQAQASALSALLTESANDRSDIVQAVSAIANCGDLSSAENTLNMSSTSRQSLLTQIQGMSLNGLPNSSQLTIYLIAAWQNSLSSDQSYARWAADELNSGCSDNDTSDANYQAAQTTDAQSTSNKSSFAALWNPVATSYGLPTVTTASF